MSNTSDPITPSLSPFSVEEGCEAEFDALALDGRTKPTYTVVGDVDEGVGSTYLAKNIYKAGDLKVFKPTLDEGYDKKKQTAARVPLKRGVVYGETTLKEVVAYKLDHGNWAGVPRTELNSVLMFDGEISRGSLQDYQSHVSSCEDLGWTRYDTTTVHQIGVLDVRLLNLDRHLGNILVTSNDNLVPIDHGYILPSYKDMSDVTFGWLHWHQCKKPFAPETLEYVKTLKPSEDSGLLRSMGIREESILAQYCATVFLQRACRKGLSLFQIGCLVSRGDEYETQCKFETLMDNLPLTELEVCRGTYDKNKAFNENLCTSIDNILSSA